MISPILGLDINIKQAHLQTMARQEKERQGKRLAILTSDTAPINFMLTTDVNICSVRQTIKEEAKKCDLLAK